MKNNQFLEQTKGQSMKSVMCHLYQIGWCLIILTMLGLYSIYSFICCTLPLLETQVLV